MTKWTAAGVLALFAATLVRADIPPPPPANGLKRVPYQQKVKLAKELPEYQFYLVTHGPGLGNKKATELKVNTKDAVPLSVGKYGTTLYAVPKDAAKGYATEKDLAAALDGDRVTGAKKADITGGSFRDIKKSDSRDAIVKEYVIEGVDPKEGVRFQQAKDGKRDEADDEPDVADAAELTALPGATWVAGAALFLGLSAGGVWLARRRGA